jgi:hypothetical protein
VDTPAPTARTFGYTFAFAFAAAGAYGLFARWNPAAVAGWFAASAVFASLAAFAPRVLDPLNRGWLRLGHGLGRIVSPIVLALIYFGLLTPVAVVSRAFGRDELRLKRRDVDSYWIERDPPGPAADSFRNQF